MAVNAYVEPVVSLDLDVVIAAEDLARIESVLASRFEINRFQHSLNVSLEDSDLRIQIQTDPRYRVFIERAGPREVLGLTVPVAHVDDVLRGKVWAAEDPAQRRTKRQKDLADIARLIEAFPHLRSEVPVTLLEQLL